MVPTPHRRPTDAELEILQVLWRRQPCTVREVYEELLEARGAGHTTVLKLMQIMTEKGLLERDETVRPQIFRTRYTKNQTQGQLLKEFVERAFGGSPTKLVMQALSSKPSTAEERRRIRELLDELEEEAR